MASEGLFSVNWKNPMLLGAEHLQLADLMADRARRWLAHALGHPAGHYGLVPPLSGTGKGLEMSADLTVDHLSVSVQLLTALAPDGTPLVFDEAAYAELSRALTTQCSLAPGGPDPTHLSVIVRPVDPAGQGAGSSLEVGDPDPAEEPPRSPLRTLALELAVEPGTTSSGSSLKIAEVAWDGTRWSMADGYVPPCLTSGAWPPLQQRYARLRAEVHRLREVMRSAVADDSEQAQASLLRPVLVAMLAAVSSLEDELPEREPRLHPHDALLTARKVMRVVRTLITARPEALDHAMKNMVQPGLLTSGNTVFFEDLNAFLKNPYDHEQLGRDLDEARELLDGLNQVVAHLLGAKADAPVVEEHDPSVYIYGEKKYRLAACGVREFQINTPEPWHVCHFRDMNVTAPKSLLLVCDRHLLVDSPRGNAGLWMLDRYEKIIAKMFKVSVDSTSDPQKVVVHYTHIGEPTVTAVSMASSGLLDLSGLGPDYDDRLRVYYEAP
jgi:hypothetical protein